eukprot:1150965-Pelagomonas_calceolata.AAC.2
MERRVRQVCLELAEPAVFMLSLSTPTEAMIWWRKLLLSLLTVGFSLDVRCSCPVQRVTPTAESAIKRKQHADMRPQHQNRITCRHPDKFWMHYVPSDRKDTTC